MKPTFKFENPITLLTGSELEDCLIDIHGLLFLMCKDYDNFEAAKDAAACFNADNLYVYIGGSHIAIHAKTCGDAPVFQNERIAIITE
jgi:hypothetical protein